MPRKSRLLVLAVTVAGSLILAGWGSAKGGPPPGPPTTAIGPILMTRAQLAAEAKDLHQPIYWAGARKGFNYEFRRTTMGYVYLRYLPSGVPAGDPGRKYLIVATYHLKHAFAQLRKHAQGNDIAGPDGSIIYVNPQFPQSVLMAFPAIDYEVEVYARRPATALAVAKSGRVRRTKT